MPGLVPGICVSMRERVRTDLGATGHQPRNSRRTPFVRLMVRTPATMTKARDGEALQDGLRGEVAFRLVLRVARKTHDCPREGRFIAVCIFVA
ncbi:hypothetical protein I3J27_06050 [Bradyrhizobium xenonodulans]|uniref:Uncharacterized protein n=1 Tax=Bradyrhizobium xenonodulans TaxID=2736875 RepID=A0ABY7MSR2_9BRAD|nr:hypothetical protein [Bradyrhizobium xenonodulans]WBL79990.1 hypothetical protein I3J27_06050 [Bradyrhizobium xenonodulans]